MHVDRLDRGKHGRLARPAQLAAQGERRGAEPARPNGDLQHVVEAGRRLPLHDLAHGLHLEGAIEGVRRPRQRGAQELEAGEVRIVAVAGVEHHVLRVALLVAHAQIVAEAPAHAAPFIVQRRIEVGAAPDRVGDHRVELGPVGQKRRPGQKLAFPKRTPFLGRHEGVCEAIVCLGFGAGDHDFRRMSFNDHTVAGGWGAEICAGGRKGEGQGGRAPIAPRRRRQPS